jgi:hypothetical protein
VNEEAIARAGLQCQRKKKIKKLTSIITEINKGYLQGKHVVDDQFNRVFATV